MTNHIQLKLQRYLVAAQAMAVHQLCRMVG
jgi:hypothetical protein